MKNLLSLLLLTLSFSIFSKDFVLILPKEVPEIAIDNIASTAIAFSKSAQPNDNVILMNGYNGIELLRIHLYDTSKFHNSKLRTKFIQAKVFPIIKKYINTYKGNKDYIHYPNILRRLKLLNKDAAVVIVASPYFEDSSEGNIYMKDGFLSDAYILTEPRYSVFGTKKIPPYLNGMKINYIYTEAHWKRDYHRKQTERFLSLYTQNIGGVLCHFTNDRSLVFNNFNTCSVPTNYQLNLSSTKLEIITIKSKAKSITQQDWLFSNSNLETSKPTTLVGSLELGITWKCLCDLDIYSKPTNDSKMLSFRNTKSPEGVHVKDYTSYTQVQKGYETIKYNVPVNITKLTAMVNFYSGKGEGIFTIRAKFNGKVYSKEYKINSTSGNHGREQKSPTRSPYWKVINIKELFLI